MNKKILFIYRRICLLSASALFVIGCTSNFDDYNTNPHEATGEQMEMDNLKTGAYFVQMQKNNMVIEQLPNIGAETYQIIQNLTGDSFAGYTGATEIWFGNSNFLTYNMFVSWRNTAFNSAFIYVMPAWKAIVKEAEKSQPQVAALATVVKVAAMHRITDMYGPLPYIRFGNGEVQVPYDSQKDIYAKFFEELDSSIETLTDFYNKDQSATILAKYDFIYSGKVDSWIKFANTLKLRLAMRIRSTDYNVNGKTPQVLAEEAVAHPVGVMTTAADLARLMHTEDMTYRHPLYVIGEGEFDDARMGATMDSYLNGYNDPRRSVYFKAASTGKYTGVRTGIEMNVEKYSGKTAPFSALNFTANSDLVWMNPAEAYFLRAEGALLGWNMKGVAKDLYEQGVRTSFEVTGASSVDTYLQDGTSKPAPYEDPQNSGNSIAASSQYLGKVTIMWDEAASLETNLERIITQKWIAVFPDGQEAWSEFRRTGYPKIFPVVKNNSGGTIDVNRQVCRIPFPSTEYSDNATNMPEAVSLLGGDDNGGTPLWWDVK